ncbi:MAG: hypothetical protein ABFS46_13995 [Myxococcota bacterium]
MAQGTAGSPDNDPRRLRELFSRTGALACEHAIPSVVVGLAGSEGDLLVPELLRFIESALRMEDAIFRMTRERAVLFVSDVDCAKAERIVDRLIQGFQERFPTADSLDIDRGYHQVEPGAGEVSAKAILPHIFTRKSR